jgi:murein DD-endopeptidase MepM/ murein hydrolase activator NlpD
MLSSLRKCHRISGVAGSRIGLILAAAALSGCSAEVSRFDLGNPEGARAQAGYAPSGGMTGRTASAEYGSAGYERPYNSGNDVARAELAPPQSQSPYSTGALPPQDNSYGQGGRGGYGQSTYGQSPSAQRAPAYGAPSGGSQSSSGSQGYPATPSYSPSRTVAPIAPRQSAAAGGSEIEVQQGDTLYSLARSHGVSVNDLAAANGLTSHDLKLGQKLVLPSGASPSAAARAPKAQKYAAAGVPPSAPGGYADATPASKPAVEAPSDWTRSYTVRPGDSLYGLARQNNIKLSELERYNGISDSRKVMPGTVLKLPATAETSVADATPARDRTSDPVSLGAVSPGPVTPGPVTPGAVRLGEVPSPPATSSSQAPTLLNGAGTASDSPAGAERVARADTATATDAAPARSNSVAGAGPRLRWPVSGKVISNFGPRPDGTNNDGVNLAVPMGTDVHAAEDGVVAYAGDELKGYGNLVLIRHDNGWVTAYAHADEILVKRGDRIKRGQVIAKAGRTGQVDQPQVHFELRQSQKPVDPTPYMESL